MIERASPELLPSSGINASGKHQTCDLSPALSPLSLPHPLNLDSGGVRTQRASWAGRGGEQGGMMEGCPGLAWKLSGGRGVSWVISLFPRYSLLFTLRPSAVTSDSGCRKEREERRGQRKCWWRPLGGSETQMLAVPRVDCPVRALETPAMGRPFPEQGDMTSRQVLTPSPRLHTPPLECATGDPQPSSLLLSTKPRARALPGGGGGRRGPP